MAKKPTKPTIQRDSVFRRTGGETEAPSHSQGLSAEETEATTRQTGVWLAEGEFEWLDERILEIKRSGWRGITRSALLRALVKAAMKADPDLQGVLTEDEIVERLSSRR